MKLQLREPGRWRSKLVACWRFYRGMAATRHLDHKTQLIESPMRLDHCYFPISSLIYQICYKLTALKLGPVVNSAVYRLGTLPARNLSPFRLRTIFMPPGVRFPLLSESVAVLHVSVHLECGP